MTAGEADAMVDDTDVVIKCVNSGATLTFHRETLRVADDICSFEVSLRSPTLTARIGIEEFGPPQWSGFFDLLAADWKGWTGSRAHESRDGHLKLAATSDALGHVALHLTLRDRIGDSDWLCEYTLTVEAGRLGEMARELRTFFGC
ncbi:MAG: DUF6228 family protein [Dongiaceae bacterium]